MKKITYLKTLLVGLCAMVATSAWAGDEWSIDFAALGANYDDKTGVTISSEVATISNTSMGTCSVGEQLLNEHFILQTGTTWLIRKANGLYQGNGGGRAMGMLNCTKGQLITIVGTGDPNPSTNATLKSNDGNIYIYSVNEDGNVKFTPARYLYFTSISVANPSASAVDYKVIYMYGDTEIKDPSTYSGNSGDPATITSSDKAPIYKDGKKYIYTSDDSEGKTINSDGSTIVKVNFREAEVWNYTVNFVAEGDINLGSKAGTGFEGDQMSVPYPKYLAKDGQLYMRDKGLSTVNEFNYKFNLDADNKATSITYAAVVDNPETEEVNEAVTNVIFCSEGEDIEGLTPITAGNTTIRSSNSSSAYAPRATKIVTLGSGTYKIHVIAYDATKNYGNHFVFSANNQQVADFTTSVVNIQEFDSEEFTLENSADLVIAKVGGSTVGLDAIYITSDDGAVTDVVTATIGSNGYTTFASTSRLDLSDLPEGLTAYKASIGEGNNTVNFTEISTAVPAYTGLLLKGEANKLYSIKVAESAEALTGNAFKVNINGTSFDAAENTTYFAMVKDSDPLKFGTVDPSSVAIPANKAYLAVVGNSEARLTVTFDGETTAIKSIENAETSNAIYNLNGQRVEKAQKGLYIVNGKKTIVK